MADLASVLEAMDEMSVYVWKRIWYGCWETSTRIIAALYMLSDLQGNCEFTPGIH